MNDILKEGRRRQYVPVLLVSFDETLPAMLGRSVSLDMLSSVRVAADSEFCSRLELFAAL